MPCFMGRNSSSRYAWCKVYRLTQPQCLGTGIIVIAQHPRGRLNGYVSQTLRIQQKARHLRASDPILGSDLRILCNVKFDPGLRIYSQQQTRKNEYPKKRVFKHIASRRVSTGRYHALGTGGRADADAAAVEAAAGVRRYPRQCLLSRSDGGLVRLARSVPKTANTPQVL